MFKREVLRFVGGWALMAFALVAPQASATHEAGVRLSLTLAAAPNPVALGETLRWHARLTNDDPRKVPALDAVFQDVLPAGVTLEGFEPSRGACDLRAGGVISCPLGDLGPGETAQLSVWARIDAVPENAALFNAVAVTAFAPGAWRADAVVASTRTTVLAARSEPPPVAKPTPPPPPAPVEPRTIAVSPTCVEPGGQLTLIGQGFDIVGLGNSEVRIGQVRAVVLAASATGLVVEVPALSEGPATIEVRGVDNAPTVRISPACHPDLFTEADAEAGHIAGDVLIFFKEPLSPEALAAFQVEYGFLTLIEHPLLGYYFAQLDPAGTAPRVEPDAPVACRVNLRDSAQPLDLVLLADRSGTMSAALFKAVFAELTHQMYCLLNRDSRVALMTYDDQATLVAGLAPWQQQSAALAAWAQRPLITGKGSDLAGALGAALDHLAAHQRPGVGTQVLVLTRGPAAPRILDPQPLIERARSSGAVVHGLALTGPLFPASDHAALLRVTQATGRGVVMLDERDVQHAAAAVRCTIVYGVYGQDCDPSLASTQATAAVESITCVVVQGVYGVDTCGQDGLSRIPTLPFDPTAAVIEHLNNDPRVEEAFFNRLLDDLQNDPDLPQQSWLLDLGLPAGFETFFPHRGAGVSLAVIDSGVDLSLTGAQDAEVVLNSAAPQGLNLAPVPPNNKDMTGNDELGHGTAVSSIAASVIGNGFNGGGVAPGATIVALKVFSRVGGKVKTSNDSVAQALMNAFVLGVDVINMSLGCEGCKPDQEKQLRKFYGRVLDNLFKSQPQGDAPPIIVAASGNDGENLIDAPAFYDDVIAVGSVRPDLTSRSAFSNFGPELDLVAPGENTLTTLVGGDFNSPGVGTSFATPQVAGLVALILAERPGLTREGVLDWIKQCFVIDLGPPGWDEETGWGRIFVPTREAAAPGCL